MADVEEARCLKSEHPAVMVLPDEMSHYEQSDEKAFLRWFPITHMEYEVILHIEDCFMPVDAARTGVHGISNTECF